MSWLRVRLFSEAEDFRPIYKPPALPEGPWWCSGYDSDDRAVIIAYVKSLETIEKQWPEGEIDFFDNVEKVEFSSRFPKPEWWNSQS